MNSGVLPYGNHYGIVEDLMAQTPSPGPALMEDLYGGLPAVGSPESQNMYELMNAPVAAAPSSPEDMAELRWDNWSRQNQFEIQGPQAQRSLAQMYYNNVLPYVASALGAPEGELQQEFVTNYPSIHMLTQYDSPEFLAEAQEGEDMAGLSGRLAVLEEMEERGVVLPENLRGVFGLTGEVPKAVIDAWTTGNPLEQAQALMSQRSAYLDAYGRDNLTREQIQAYMATGNDKHLVADTEDVAKDALALQRTDQRVITGVTASIRNIDSTIRQAGNLLGVLEDGSTSGGLGVLDTVLPITGQLGRAVAEQFPFATNASAARQYLKTLRASAVFDALQDLRDSSVDGSSGLGQVTNVEIELLANRFAALDLDGLSREQAIGEAEYFLERLLTIKNHLLADQEALEDNYVTLWSAPSSERIRLDAQGNIIRSSAEAPEDADETVITLTEEQAQQIFGDPQ